MGERAVLYEAANRIGMITLNRPDHRNAMTPELLDAFSEAIGEARERRGTPMSPDYRQGSLLQRRCRPPLVDAAKRSRKAIPGRLIRDVRAISAGAGRRGARDRRDERPYRREGGFGLALLADIRVANVDAKYGVNFARLGIHSGLGISYLLPRLVGAAYACELLFTGKLIRGDEALRIGLVTHAEEAEEVLPTAMGTRACDCRAPPRRP